MTLLLIRISICISIASVTLYACIEKHNELTELRIAIPMLAKEVHDAQEDNKRLRYEIDRFESPVHLMELSKKPEFSHLKYPDNEQIIRLPLAEGEGGQIP